MPGKRNRNAARSGQRSTDTRQRIAFEAARLMSIEGLNNFGIAKRKAAERLGIHNDRDLPGNREIEQQLIAYQRLFGGPDHQQRQQRLRQAALESMDFFAEFSPRLVGAVLHGTAESHAAISLHLFSDNPEQVRLFLQRHEIPFDEQARRVRVLADDYQERPSLTFAAGEEAFDLTVFGREEIRQAPLSEVDGRPMQRANARQLRELIDEDSRESAAVLDQWLASGPRP